MNELNYLDLEHVFISEQVKNSALAYRIQKLIPSSKYSIVKDSPLESKGELSARQFDQSKKRLFVTNFKGQFFKRCPGAKPGLTCCNYFVLNLGQQCNMNCSYCYLQSFLNSSVMQVYANLDQAIAEMQSLASQSADNSIRIGTGEVIDSLSLDPLTLYSRELISFFREVPLWKLEFKTKSSYVDQFLDVDHAGNVIVSFSVNPQYIIDREEHGTASLNARLKSARKARDRNFLVSFHIDPVIYHLEWKDSYSSLVSSITQLFKPEEVLVMSLGALRFQPHQRHMMRERFGMGSLVTQAEMFAGSDGKYRYDQSQREEMFRFILEKFRSHSREWKTFLCMETPETWLGAMGQMPKSTPGLESFFVKTDITDKLV